MSETYINPNDKRLILDFVEHLKKKGTNVINLWLDDVREPPEGWKWAKTVKAAILYMKANLVENMSLDHDLDLCPTCHVKVDDVTIVYPPCRCGLSTGYDFVKWMAENKVWPINKPQVHSMNPAGAANMRATIERYYVPPTK